MAIKGLFKPSKRPFSRFSVFFILLSIFIFTTPIFVFAEPLLNPDNGHYYDVRCSDAGFTWYQARDEAAEMTFEGLIGHLATITSPEEEAFILDSFEAIGELGGWDPWVGATDEATEGFWRWITGEPWSYENWNEYEIEGEKFSEPNGGTEENCLEYFYGADAWNDANCELERNCFVVEFESSVTPGKKETLNVPMLNAWGIVFLFLILGVTSALWAKRKINT